MCGMPRLLLPAAAWWAAMLATGYALGWWFESSTSGDVAYTLAGLPQLLVGFAIAVVSLAVAAWMAWTKQFALAAIVASGPLVTWAGWEAAARL